MKVKAVVPSFLLTAGLLTAALPVLSQPVTQKIAAVQGATEKLRSFSVTRVGQGRPMILIPGLSTPAGKARDEEEKRGLRAFRAVSIVLTLAAASALALSSGPRSLIVSFALFYVSLISLHIFWLPRIVARRLAAELAENPEAAGRRQRRDRWLSAFGAIAGLLAGGGGVLWAVLHM
jgi:hypothetical protein